MLVTHGVNYLPQTDQIIVMKDGRVSEMGTYNKLVKSNGAFAEFIKTYLNVNEDDEDADHEGITRGPSTYPTFLISLMCTYFYSPKCILPAPSLCTEHHFQYHLAPVLYS